MLMNMPHFNHQLQNYWSNRVVQPLVDTYNGLALPNIVLASLVTNTQISTWTFTLSYLLHAPFSNRTPHPAVSPRPVQNQVRCLQVPKEVSPLDNQPHAISALDSSHCRDRRRNKHALHEVATIC